MILRFCLFVTIIVFAAYGTLSMLSNPNIYQLYGTQDWKYYFYVAAPWVSLLLAIKGWTISRMWRRMMDHSQALPTLSRGEHHVKNTAIHQSILERICLTFILLSLITLWRFFE